MFSSQLFQDKKILVGLTGCIAAYKTCYLIRHLVKEGAKTRVILTRSAAKFITPLTLETLSQHPVNSHLFPKDFAATHHIELADWADAAVITPATANIIGKLANGIADDLLSTLMMAVAVPKMLAPAMNSKMWANPAVVRNIAQLVDDGYFICPPESGFLAEGYDGIGRLAELESQVQHLYRTIHPAPESLAGKTVLITAGGTREYLDPVRMLANRSSGKMGYALAWEAFARGAQVILVHGPGNLASPAGITTVPVTSAAEMFNAVEKHFSGSDFFISAAAVADYRPAQVSTSKIKKNPRQERLTLPLESTTDILKAMGERRQPHQKLIGFAVETNDPLKNARKKLAAKKLDLIVLNNPNESGAGFEVDTNKVTLVGKTDAEPLTVMPKLDVSRHIFEAVLKQ